jgi:methionine biosynthesis protein MetW
MPTHDPIHFSYDEIVRLVEPGSSVLDLGCGDGELLSRLMAERKAVGRGVEIDESMISACISRGISVFHGNLDEGLKDYATGSYDVVILNRTLQMIHQPVMLLQEMLRVGRRAIVNFPNFGHVTNRVQLGFQGRMPVNRNLPYEWYNTPNIHFCTRRDFTILCRELGIAIVEEIAMKAGKRVRPVFRNLLSTEVLFVLGQ